MDLTNINPCMSCTKWGRCVSRLDPNQMVQSRIIKIVIAGKDCFEDGDDG